MDKILNVLGLVKRARKLVSGEEFVLQKIKSQKAYIVFLANDAGINTTKRITDKSNYYKVKLITLFNTDELNKAIGTKNRKAIAITDINFANMINKKLEEKGV